jgi:hypothetical protein
MVSQSNYANGGIRTKSSRALKLNPNISFYDAHGKLSEDKTEVGRRGRK